MRRVARGGDPRGAPRVRMPDREPMGLVTAGGRVLNVTALGADPGSARDAAYAAARDDLLRRACSCRRDIAAHARRGHVRDAMTSGRGGGPPHEARREAPGISLVPEPMQEAEVQAQLDDIDVDAPRVGIVMGSKSDMEAMEKAAQRARRARHPARGAGDVRPPRTRRGRRIRQERAHARPARDHRRRRHLRGAARAPWPPTPTCP